jgi:hypothetical protein
MPLKDLEKRKAYDKARHKARYRTKKNGPPVGYNKDVNTAWHRKKRYGITAEQYKELLDKQHGACGICGGVPENHTLCVDHCHRTGRIRGLLCRPCNTAIGLLEDDPMKVGAALRYLMWT